LERRGFIIETTAAHPNSYAVLARRRDVKPMPNAAQPDALLERR
jgi:hypothetical protein